MLTRATSLIDLDRAHLIHPVAPWRRHEQRGVTVLESGEGAWLRDADGNQCSMPLRACGA
jgi:adenosylmethionine-8-amino-7-oxononanoate aminotransferase